MWTLNRIKGISEINLKHSFLRVSVEDLFAEWMIASAPPLTPTPSWMESNNSIASDFASFTKHLALRRLRSSLTAIGRTLPFFLDRAVSDALQRAFETIEGNLPVLPVITNFVIASRSDSEWSRKLYILLRAIDDLDTSWKDQLQFTYWKFSIVQKLCYRQIDTHLIQYYQAGGSLERFFGM